MKPIGTYSMWTSGNTVTLTAILDWQKMYVITGHLTLTDGDDYAHLYISSMCRYYGGDQVLCEIRDWDGDDSGLSVCATVGSVSRLTIKLKTKGGKHQAEGVIYEY